MNAVCYTQADAQLSSGSGRTPSLADSAAQVYAQTIAAGGSEAEAAAQAERCAKQSGANEIEAQQVGALAGVMMAGTAVLERGGSRKEVPQQRAQGAVSGVLRARRGQ